MNVFIYSLAGEGLTLVPSLRAGGHDVLMHIKEESARRIGDGLVWKTDDPDASAHQADLIIVSENGGLGAAADRWRAEGLPVWNGGAFAERLEYDRNYGMEVFREAGIPIPDTFEVSSVEEVKALAKEEFARTERAVIKISGEEGAGTSFSFVAANRQQLLDQVSHWDDDGLLPAKWKGIVQRFVDGIEVSVEAWWNGEEWSNHNITIEEKKCWPGNLGPAVGCAFNTVAQITESSKLFRQALAPVAPLLKQRNYIGQIDTNSIVDSEGIPHALEFTSRCGYDATPTLIWGRSHGYGDLVLAAMGADVDAGVESAQSKVDAKGSFRCGVRVHIPPYPFESADLCEAAYKEALGAPIDIPENIADYFYLFDAMKEDGAVKCAGVNGIVGIALGSGSTPAEAGRAAYRVAEKVKVPNKAYRGLDGFQRASEQIPELISMGLIKLA